MNLLIKIGFLLFLILLCQRSWSQSGTYEHERIKVWSIIKIQKDVNKKFELHSGFQVRTNPDHIEEYFGSFGGSYKFLKWLELASDYRYIQDRKRKGGYQTKHRISIDLKTSSDWKRFQGKTRIRYTNKYTEETKDNATFFRLKGIIEYDISKFKWTPYMATESFYSIEEHLLEKFRYSLGATYKLSSNHRIEASYFMEDRFVVKEFIHILSLQYRFRF